MTMKKKLTADSIFQSLLKLSACILIIIILGFFITTIYYSRFAFIAFGYKFITGSEWNPVSSTFGALPFVIGTLLTSFIALIISFPISLTVALFLGEYFTTGLFNNIIKTSVELLAGIPSIVYGFWGLFIFVPIIRSFEIKLGIAPYGVGIFTSALILSLMIIPYSSSIIREVITMVPKDLKDAAYSLGATRYETIRRIMIPYASSGIFAGVMLSLGRALGETMAVTMVIGNSNMLPTSIFGPGNTMASVIANEFTEATSDIYLSSLVGIGLLLFVMSTIINIIGRYTIKKLVPQSNV
jgi:phosphate transport system permease protein